MTRHTSTNVNSVMPVPLPRRKRTAKPKKTDAELTKLFWDAAPETLFGQETIAPVINRSIKTLECDRWRGAGIPYRKCSGRVLYRKADVVSWIESHALVTSTSEYTQEVSHG